MAAAVSLPIKLQKESRDVAQVHVLLLFTEETCIFTSIDTSLVSALFK